MKICVVGETHPDETRVAMVPADVKKLTQAGASVAVLSGAGLKTGWTDQDYQGAGAEIISDRQQLFQSADILLGVRKPDADDIERLRKGVIWISYLDPFNDGALLQTLASRGITSVSMEMIPRSTRAQKMDALTSQANLAGYVAVILAANHLNKIFPMMMTAAGTIAPVRVFVVGAGVAGLQAIATAKRLGARVEAFDTRPVVAEQIQSLGAKFVKIDLGDTGQTKEGYAKALTEEQLAKQREGLRRVCAESDIVITTAQVFGRKAPVIITSAMLDSMKPGSVVVDLAVETGGNVEGIPPNQITDRKGVTLIGLANVPGRVPVHASQVYSANLTNLISEFWSKEQKTFELKLDDEILKSCVITHNGSICNERFAPNAQK